MAISLKKAPLGPSFAELGAYFDSRNPYYKSVLGALREGEAVTYRLSVASENTAREVFFCISTDGGEPQKCLMSQAEANGTDTIFEITHTINSPGLYWYWFELHREGNIRCVGIIHRGQGAIVEGFPKSWQLTVYSKDYETPEFFRGGIMYHIFVDRFAKGASCNLEGVKKDYILREDWGGLPNFRPLPNGDIKNNDFFGGNLNGIIRKLPYLKSLNVTCLYLSPVFESYSNHKYDTGNYEEIDPMFGTEKDFTKLCQRAGELGMSVILDGVFNHTGDDSKYFNKYERYDTLGAYKSKDSPYFNWYEFFEFPDDYRCWWGIKNVPTVNKNNDFYRDYIIRGENSIIKRWLRAGAAGWRLDVVDELPGDMVEEIRAAARSVKPDALILGEVWEDASNKIAYGVRRRYFQGLELDCAMNYPLRSAIINFLRGGDASEISESIELLCENYPKVSLDCAVNILSTHDTVRISNVLTSPPPEGMSLEERAYYTPYNEEKTAARTLVKLAAALQMTLPGVPTIYYGDEALLDGYADPFNRKCFPWGNEDSETLEFYRKLTGFRAKYSALREGEYQTLFAREGVYIFKRFDKETEIIVMINARSLPEKVELPEGDGYNLIEGCLERGHVTLPPLTAAIYEILK